MDRPIIRQKNGLITQTRRNQDKDKNIQPHQTKRAGRHFLLDLLSPLTPYQNCLRKLIFFPDHFDFDFSLKMRFCNSKSKQQGLLLHVEMFF